MLEYPISSGSKLPLSGSYYSEYLISFLLFGVVTGVTLGLGPNFFCAEIVHLEPRTLFAASHTLVPGHTIKVAL